MFSTSSEIAKVLMLKSNILTLHSKTCKKIRYLHINLENDTNLGILPKMTTQRTTLRHGDFERNYRLPLFNTKSFAKPNIDVKNPLCSLSYNFTATSTDKMCGTFNFLSFVHIHYKPLPNVVLKTLKLTKQCLKATTSSV